MIKGDSASIGSLRLEKLCGPEAIDAIETEWDALNSALSPRTPFSTPLWNKLWWRHLSARSRVVKDEFFVHILRDGGNRLIAVAPLMLTHRPAIGPLRFRELQFFGADPNVTEMRGLVCHPRDQERAIEAITAGMLDDPAGTWDWMKWGFVRADGTLCPPLAQTGHAACVREVPAYLVELAPDWTQFRAQLPRNTKEALRKCYNSLKREGYNFRFSVVQRPEEAGAALELFFALHRARAEADFGVKHTNVFAKPAAQQFLTDYVMRMAESGQLRLFQLEVDGAVRATRIGFQYDDELYLYYSGYDPAWAKYSIMTTAVAEAMRWAIEHGLTKVNLSTGRDASKTRWRPRELLYREVVQVAPTRRGRWAFEAFQAVRAAGSQGRLERAVAALRRPSGLTIANGSHVVALNLLELGTSELAAFV